MAISATNGARQGFLPGEYNPSAPKTHETKPETYGHFYNDLAQARNAVEDQFRRGEISEAEKTGLLQRLDQVADEVRVDKTDGVKGVDWKKYQAELGGIRRDLRTEASDGNIDGAQRAEHLKSWVGQLAAQGKLTEKEASDYKAEVKALEGRCPPATEKDFADLEKKVRGSARDGDLNEGKLDANFAKRMADGDKDGSLTATDQAQLTAELDKLKGLSGDERAAQLHKIDSMIYQLRHNDDIDPIKRRASLQTSIEKSALSPEEKTHLKALLSRYSASELNDFGAMLRTMNVPLKP